MPCAVKVVGGGSSIGVALPEDRAELRRALAEILRYGDRVVVEEKIRGRELTVPVLDGRALSPIEIVPPEGQSFDYVAKYQSGAAAAREICPAPITEGERTGLCEAALKVHKALGCLSIPAAILSWTARAGPGAWRSTPCPGMTPKQPDPQGRRGGGHELSGAVREDRRLSLDAQPSDKIDRKLTIS